MSILFNRRVSPQVDPTIFPIRKITSQFFFSTVFVSSVPKLPLFSRPHTLFLQAIRCLNQVSFYSCEVSPFLFRQCSYPVILKKILTELQVIIIRSFSSPVEPIQAFGVDHILFPCFICLFVPVHLLKLPRLLFYCSGVLKISR